MKWLWLLVIDPLKGLDLLDKDGNADHGKVMGFLAFVLILASLLWTDGRVPSLGHTIALISAIFGARVFVAFLKHKPAVSTEIVQRTEKPFGPSTEGLDG